MTYVPALALGPTVGHARAVLDERERRLIRLFAAAVRGEWEQVRQLRAEAAPDEPDRAWRETVLMVHLFAGFPRQVEAYGVLATAGGLGAPDGDEHEQVLDQPERGRVLFETIYASQAERVLQGLSDGHPDLRGWILGHAYGRVLTRPGLSARMRELLAVAALSVLHQQRQLASHVRGAVRCGATAEEVAAAVDAVGAMLPPGARPEIDEVVRRFATA